MELVIIVAADENNVIGNKDKIPWREPEHREKYRGDMQRFRELTMNHPIIIGRKTFQSIGKPLIGRKNIVLTHDKNFNADGIAVFNRLDSAIALASRYSKIAYVIGGAEIYRQTFDLVSRIELTKIHERFEGDAYFPYIDPMTWEEKSRVDKTGYSFITYERRS